jgi:hypothetical protein
VTDLSIDTEPAGCGATCAAHEIWEAIDHLVRLITPDRPVLLERRLDELGLSALHNMIAEKLTQIDVQQQHIALLTAQLTNQAMRLERLQNDMGRLSACVDMRPHLVGGRLPALSELTQLRVQIFHTPDLLPTARKAKTVWSLRITVWINGVRAVEEIKGVPLYSCREFSQKVANLRGDVPNGTKEFAEQYKDRDPEDTLVGMLRAKTRGKGTPYVADQFCVLLYHLTESPVVGISIGGETVTFQKFRAAAGTKEGRAKWWDEWVR